MVFCLLRCVMLWLFVVFGVVVWLGLFVLFDVVVLYDGSRYYDGFGLLVVVGFGIGWVVCVLLPFWLGV